MKMSELFTKTDKSAKDYDSANATLLQKGGFIFQTMAGAYSFLPLGLRVLNKIENIVRKNMDQVSQEILMPTTSPLHLWETTGRLDKMDVQTKVVPASELAKATSDNEYVLNSTHEESNVPILQKYVISYKDLPVSTYQIQTKFRNEERPKSGLLRGREFRMKDMYSYHATEQDLKKYYELMKEVYVKTFDELGIGEDTVIAMASGGAFTDEYSHEFQTICETGEDTLFYVKSKNLYFNKEVTPSKAPEFKQNEKQNPKEDVLGEGIVGVEALAKFLDISVEKTTKTLLYKADDRFVAIAVRGDYDINELKVKKELKVSELSLATSDEIKRLTGAQVGYLGPIGLSDEIEVYFDDSTADRINFECGANKTNYHSVNINWGRDLAVPEKFYDFKEAKEGDLYPETCEKYELVTASEVGNIFPLYSKYSDAFDFNYVDGEGKERSILMGCYGIGTSRVMGIIVEKYHDKSGIIWPSQVAPFKVHLISLGDNEEVLSRASELYESLRNGGVEVIWDDRDIGAGEKFADADLIGNPFRLVVSMRSIENGGVELKKRTEDKTRIVGFDELREELFK